MHWPEDEALAFGVEVRGFSVKLPRPPSLDRIINEPPTGGGGVGQEVNLPAFVGDNRGRGRPGPVGPSSREVSSREWPVSLFQWLAVMVLLGS